MLKAVILRELLLAIRRPADVLSGVAFFLMVGSLFPLAIGPDSTLLRQIAPGVVWVAALLAVLLGQHRLFEGDYVDGSLEQWLLAPAPLPLLVGVKVGAQSLVGTLPLLLATPLLGWQYGLGEEVMGVLLLSLALGTPSLCVLALPWGLR